MFKCFIKTRVFLTSKKENEICSSIVKCYVPSHGLPGRRASAGPGRSGWNLTRVPQLGPEVVRVLQVVVVGSRHCVERQEETDR